MNRSFFEFILNRNRNRTFGYREPQGAGIATTNVSRSVSPDPGTRTLPANFVTSFLSPRDGTVMLEMNVQYEM